jgi:hypothetical protein
MNTWTDADVPGVLEQQVAQLLDQVHKQGTTAEAAISATAALLCLFAYASRPPGATCDQVRNAVMKLVWESLNALGGHPFATPGKLH